MQKFNLAYYITKVCRLCNKLNKHISIFCNRVKFSLYGIKYGENLNIYNNIYIHIRDEGVITIGNNFTFSSGSGINPLCRNIKGEIFIDKGAEIIIGNKVGISSASLFAKEKIVIGNGVNIGGDCIIMDTDAHNLDWRVRARLRCDENGNIINDTATAKSAPIIIEDNVLIGTRCIVLKGVTIGARSIIAAGSVVTKSIPPDCIAGGNPCKILKELQN